MPWSLDAWQLTARMRTAFSIRIRGVVQGVGFRPFVYRLARAHSLAGWVINAEAGVEVHVEGTEEELQAFIHELETKPPPAAQITWLDVQVEEPEGLSEFTIRESLRRDRPTVRISPDLPVCNACLAELFDPHDRRYLYPYINCTNCGPRYTVILGLPYDRPFTTMNRWPLDEYCAAEYHDPANRRFHAQPVACPACGPHYELRVDAETVRGDHASVRRTAELLVAGKIVAIKGLGGYHLACDARNSAAVRALRERKYRKEKPFALMVQNLEAARELVELSSEAEQALIAVARPIVLAPARAQLPGVAPDCDELGVMLPYTPLHHLLFDGASYDALVMTSGNLSEEPIASRNEEVAQRLHTLADFFLIHNRKIQTRVDDSVVRTFEGRERTLRRSRGFAPFPIDLGIPVEQILACGGELKNVFCLTKDHYAVLSQHIGDLENLETLRSFEETLDHMKRFFRISPVAVAYDLHPRYLSTRLALSMEGIEKIGVQHHHAHIASCMAENRLDGKVIGVALDGTGYGTDGKIWGGEFLVCDYADFERRFHFRYVPLAGGDTAVRQVWRSALAYLLDAGCDTGRVPNVLAERVPAKARGVVEKMIARRINTVDTSSCGRLFDAVAAILGIRLEANYEGQAAMELEALADSFVARDIEPYPFDVTGGEIDFRETIRHLAKDFENTTLASARFHETLARVIFEICGRIQTSDGLNRVCLSGGVFQNFTLLRSTVDLLRRAGFEVFLHARVPPNDGGLCLGQAAIANRRLQSGLCRQ